MFYFYKSIIPLLLLIATLKSWISCRDGCAGLLLVLHLLLVLNHHRWNSVNPQELFWTADVYLNCLNWCHFPYSRGRSTNYSDRLHGCSAASPRCYKDIYVNSFFPRTALFWNSLPVECLTLEPFVSGLWNACLWFFFMKMALRLQLKAHFLLFFSPEFIGVFYHLHFATKCFINSWSAMCLVNSNYKKKKKRLVGSRYWLKLNLVDRSWIQQATTTATATATATTTTTTT